MNEPRRPGPALASPEAMLDALDGAIDDARLLEQRRRAVVALSAPRRPRGRALALGAAAALAVGVLVLSVALLRRAETPVSAPGQEMRLDVSGEARLDVEIAPGARVELARDTHGASRRVAPDRHRVVLERGRMRFDVDPRRNLSLTVSAGDLEVSVVGTVFAVERDPTRRSTAVEVLRGTVRVSGILLARPVLVAAGQSIRVGPEGVALSAPSADPAAATGSASAPAPAASSSSAPAASGGAGASARALPDWRALHRAGDHRAALAAARQVGIEGIESSGDAAELLALADAERFGGAAGDARRTLMAVRRRFPRAAGEAAFRLARLEADQLGNAGEAARWLRTYLAEQPAGLHAEEARGRLLTSLLAAGEAAEARRVARDYLARHPGGPYSAVARRGV